MYALCLVRVQAPDQAFYDPPMSHQHVYDVKNTDVDLGLSSSMPLQVFDHDAGLCHHLVAHAVMEDRDLADGPAFDMRRRESP